jgi:hypothetical protein
MKNTVLFSQEELLYLLRTLNLPDMPGMGDKPWGHIPQEQVLLVMETVGSGLLARQVIQFGGYEMKVEEDIMSLLAACASPQQMLLLNYSQGNETIAHNFFRGQAFDIEHDLPHPWVHRFQQTEKSDMGLALLQSLTENTPDGQNSDVFEINQAELDEIRQVAAGDPEKAAQALQSKGLPADEAGRLSRVFAAPTLKMLVMAFQQINPEPQGSVFSLLADAESTWLVSAGKPGDPIAQVRQVGRQELQNILVKTFESFESA